MDENLKSLLTDTLNRLDSSVGELQKTVVAARLDSAQRFASLETKVETLQNSMGPFREEVRKEARRWGSIGGVLTAFCAIIATLVKDSLSARPILRILPVLLLSCTLSKAACPSGTQAITDTLLNPDGSLYSGQMTYERQYDTPPVKRGAFNLTITNGSLSLCLTPGNYVVTTYVPVPAISTNKSTSRLAVTYWIVGTAGPYMLANVQTSSIPTPGLSITPSQLGGAPSGFWCVKAVRGAPTWRACVTPVTIASLGMGSTASVLGSFTGWQLDGVLTASDLGSITAASLGNSLKAIDLENNGW